MDRRRRRTGFSSGGGGESRNTACQVLPAGIIFRGFRGGRYQGGRGQAAGDRGMVSCNSDGLLCIFKCGVRDVGTPLPFVSAGDFPGPEQCEVWVCTEPVEEASHHFRGAQRRDPRNSQTTADRVRCAGNAVETGIFPGFAVVVRWCFPGLSQRLGCAHFPGVYKIHGAAARRFSGLRC